MSNNVNITSKGIQKILKSYDIKQSLAEYIWNGFDAKANTIELNYKVDGFNLLTYIEIKDDGTGIDFDKLSEKFRPFYDSEKIKKISSPKNTSNMHGKNGIGRLTFFTFAKNAIWDTTYQSEESFVNYSIRIDATQLNTFTLSKKSSNQKISSGTVVKFANIYPITEEFLKREVIPFLKMEFCWYLELNIERGFKIKINGTCLDYSSNVLEREENKEIVYKLNNTVFQFKYIQWSDSLHKELSKYYFLNSKKNEVYKDYTTLNKKGDQFYHSIYIESSFFDNFDFNSDELDSQGNLFWAVRYSGEYKCLIEEVNNYLRLKRKPFLKRYASKLIEQYEEAGIMPSYNNDWERKFKRPQLEETIAGLYEVQPKLFNNLNIDQKKAFVRLLDLLLDSNERDNIFKIIEEIVELEPKEREDLAELFKSTRLNRITETIKLIEDRYKTVYQLKEIVFNSDFKANEKDHLQKLIECHYWLFGEQYHLVTAAEQKFDEALRRYHYILYDQDVDKKIDHPDKYKEMDIFACRQNYNKESIDNIVIELKHPDIKIGRSQYIQIDKYLDVIVSEPMFNANNMNWEFYLIGNDFDSSGFIERQIESNQNHGIKSLIQWSHNGRVKVYAKRWSEIFNDFEIKHKFLDEKLKFERGQLLNECKTANDTITSVQNNSAVQTKVAF